MSKWQQPRHGSLAFWHRSRAKGEVQRVRAWPNVNKPVLLGLAGYKVGMTNAVVIDDTSRPSKGLQKVEPCTVVEVPPVYVYGLRFYTKDPYGVKAKTEFYSDLAKKFNIKKISTPEEVKQFYEKSKSEIYDVRALIYTDPSSTTIGRKKPHRMEVAIGGDLDEKVNYALSIFGKEVLPSEVFKEGEYVDIIAVTKGKGWQGPVKRFGVRTQRPKATGKERHVGTLGAWHPNRVLYSVPMAGQMGFHRRTEYNKRILKIGDAKELQQDGGFLNYGVVKNRFILIKGSIPGVAKRLVRLRKSLRMQSKPVVQPKIIKID